MDEMYNPPTGSERRKDWKINENYVEFPGVTGKRTIVIHWTFVEDDDESSLYTKARAEAEANGKYKFHYQFSGKLAERSMDGVNQYLKEKKEEKGKANELKNAELPLLRLTDAEAYKEAFVALETAFEECFDDGNFVLASNWSILAKLSNPEIKLQADVFRDNVNKHFADNGVYAVFVNLDEKNNRIFFNEELIDEQKDNLSKLSIDASGKLMRTPELVKWWSNSTNKAKTFGVALAELTRLKEVNFAELKYSAGVDLNAVDADEWEKFANNEVLHRYRKEEDLRRFYCCSGVKFTFVPKKNDTKFKAAIVRMVGGNTIEDDIDLNDRLWVLNVAEAFGAVEVKGGRRRLMWCNRARKLLKDVVEETDDRQRKLKAEFFADGVDRAMTWDDKPANCIDFTVGEGEVGFDCVSKAWGCKELWDVLKDKFATKDDFVCICSNEAMDTQIDDIKTLGDYFVEKNWWITIPSDGVYEVHVKEPAVPATSSGAVGSFTAETGAPDTLQWNDYAKDSYNNDDFSEFMKKVAMDQPNVRKIDFTKYDSKNVDVTVLPGYPGWEFAVCKADSPDCCISDFAKLHEESKVAILGSNKGPNKKQVNFILGT